MREQFFKITFTYLPIDLIHSSVADTHQDLTGPKLRY